MHSTRVLVSGASVAGPALAYWLDRYGFRVTVVERAPEPRPGGQAIDVRGPALETVARMGRRERLAELRTALRGMSVVDDEGRELYSTTGFTFSGGDLAQDDVEVLRDDLSTLLVDAGSEGVEYLYGDSIASLTEHDDAVAVRFESGRESRYDIVVGADGIHSHTRRLAFGPEEKYLSSLGGYLAVWTAPNILGMDRWETVYYMDGDDSGAWGGMAMSVRDNSELRVYVGINSDVPPEHQLAGTTDDHRRLMQDAYAEAGWEMPRLLPYMWEAPDFHFDAMAQIHMDSWSRGRVVLLGDAAHCGSPASGQGTSMALVGAYVLAGELYAAGGDHVAAFAAYERELREWVRANQRMAIAFRERADETRAALKELRGESGRIELPEDASPQMNTGFYDVAGGYTLKDY